MCVNNYKQKRAVKPKDWSLKQLNRPNITNKEIIAWKKKKKKILLY